MRLLAPLLAILTAGLLALPAQAKPFQVGIALDKGGRDDKSFNAAAFKGGQEAEKALGISLKVLEGRDDNSEPLLRSMAERRYDLIIAVGFSQGESVKKVAAQFPDRKFVLIDAKVDLPNVKSILFEEHEGSFLVGALAAMKSPGGKLGFIGGMDIPLIRKFGCGYVGGAKAAGATDVIQNMTGDTPAAWNDPTKGGEIAKSQIDQGADVVYAAAGGTGVGVLQAAADAGKLGIGVDSNQNGLHPGKILTSMVKRVDLAVYDAFMDAKNGEFTGGINDLGLKEDGVGYAMDENNKDLVTPEMLEAVEKAKADIIAGTVTVHDYMSDNSCPY